MRIKWYGHSAFRLTSADGVNIVIDPYESGAFGGALSYGPITDPADIVLISHEHDDHNHTGGIEGAYRSIRSEGFFDIKGIRIAAIPTFHDMSEGGDRGRNLVFAIDAAADGLTIVHLGDLGHTLDQDTISRIGKVDVLMAPVGGFFTIDASAATHVMNALKPSLTIPMHFKTEKVTFPISGVDEFAGDKENVRRMDVSEIEVTNEGMPKEPEIMVLRHAH
jgi:L-ascorbate metabolism protein UlaG (beta-lactamase superfamily)